ncbi:hypothetical protein D9756_009928 [Leucocoprinus leucothites]|uniref:Uncharacterized protein n=1 Tax=Leucocoprinus leucothites TaxID=201217 RepID=A0A8H5FSL2_9AGAR|nr:hypothetical protein D9756_009928 [Leucoagaricus leucothites]
MIDYTPSSYRPDEPSVDISTEHYWLQAAFLVAVMYGIESILYMLTSFLLLKRRNAINNRKNLFLLFYVSAIFILSTLYVSGTLEFTQKAFVDGRNIPGGPGVFEATMRRLPTGMLVNITMVLKCWLCYAVNLWRCFVVYRDCGFLTLWIAGIAPAMLYLATIALGNFYIIRLPRIDTVRGWEAKDSSIATSFWIVFLVLSIFVTFSLVLRLFVYRRRAARLLGTSYGSRYTTMAAIIVDSAAIQSLFALVVIAISTSHSMRLSGPYIFLQVISPIQVSRTATPTTLVDETSGRAYRHSSSSFVLQKA